MTDEAPGGSVRFIDPSGEEPVVHEYMDDDYGLEDIHMLFGLGSLAQESGDEVVLVLNDSEVRNLKNLADAQSFDHPEGFIKMCLDLHRFVAGRDAGPYRFRADA